MTVGQSFLEMPGMERIYSYGVNFLRDQNLIAQIEVALEKESTTLNLSCYCVEAIPNSVFKLRNLKKLYLDHNQLQALPENVSDINNLEILAIDHNQITSLPLSLRNFKYLVHLNLSHNPLKQIPEFIGELTSLESLWINGADLTELPTCFENLNNLITLGARGNMILNYPPQLCCLFQLRWLTLEKNDLKQLPTEFQNLINLKHLNLNNNFFEEIPPALVHIKSLQFCFMRQNYVSAVSDFMLQQLKHLKLLDLSNNPMNKVNRKIYTYVVLEKGQSHNTELESSDSEDYQNSIASEEINDSSGDSQDEPDIEIVTTLPKLSKFVLSGI